MKVAKPGLLAVATSRARYGLVEPSPKVPRTLVVARGEVRGGGSREEGCGAVTVVRDGVAVVMGTAWWPVSETALRKASALAVHRLLT